MASKKSLLDKEFLPHTVDDLIKYADRIASGTPDEYKPSAFLYYIARIMVAIFEAIIGQLPIQVWNEYRNALDHFMRYIADQNNATDKHSSKMEGHIQRAVLDVCKYFCIGMQEKINKFIENDGIDCLRMVNNGEFYKEIQVSLATAEELFTIAKTSDSQLGSYFDVNKEVIIKYLKPCFVYLEIQRLYVSNRTNIETAAQQLRTITSTTENKVRQEESGKLHLKSHLAGHAVWALVAVAVMIAWGKALPVLTEYLPWLAVLG